MTKINLERIKYISTSMQEVIRDLDEIVLIYDKQSDLIKKHLEQSFRTSFLQYKELLGNYMSQCLKKISLSVSQINYGEAIDICIKEGFLPEEEMIYYRTLSRFRNDTAHVYKKPPFKVLLSFYKDNREFLVNINKYINEMIKESNK